MALSPVETSIVAEVHFEGFRSDTYTLQRHGWQIAFEENMLGYGDGRLILRHKASHLVAVAECKNFSKIVMGMRRSQSYAQENPVFNVVRCATNLPTRGANIIEASSNFSLIDATPNLRMMNLETINLYDLPAFAPMVAQPTQEDLIVEPADVSAMLDMIRKQQAPIQEEIRARARRREIIPVQHATIYTLPRAA